MKKTCEIALVTEMAHQPNDRFAGTQIVSLVELPGRVVRWCNRAPAAGLYWNTTHTEAVHNLKRRSG